MPKSHLYPENFNLSVPNINFQHNPVGLVTRPITDHPPLIQNTAWGAMATMNILNPGSKLAPPAQTEGVDALPSDGKEQMEEMAQYIFDMFKQGIGLLALQEVPDPNTPNFRYLVDKLKYLVGDSNLIDVAALEKQWLKTGSHRFGTSFLYNPNIFTVMQNAKPVLGSRAASYEISHNITGDKIPVANIHGDFMQQPVTMKFIDDFKGICLGDANLDDQNVHINQSNLLTLQSFDKPSIVINNQTKTANTFDIFQDTFSKAFNPNFIPSTSKIDISSQLFKYDSKQAIKHIAEFINYLQQNGKGNLVQANRVKDLVLKTLPKSSISDIIITDPEVAQAYRSFLSPPALQVIPMASQNSLGHLRDFLKFLQQHGQQHLIHNGVIKGVSLETLSGGTQAQIKITSPEVSKAYTLFANNNLKNQIIQIEDKKAVGHLRDFATYLTKTGQTHLFNPVNGKVKDVLLKTPPGSTQTQIIFNDPAVFQAYQSFLNPSQLVVKINSKEAIAHLKDFATYLEQYGQGHLVNSSTGRIQGISLKTPKGGTQAEITFENPIISQAYTNFTSALQKKITDASKLTKENLQELIRSEEKELNAGESIAPKF